ncbi:Adenosine deaminase AGSA [Verticillium dahliae VDG2]|nr:Adenosine deaminase AGSA [Verticillium dahliae VDG2]
MSSWLPITSMKTSKKQSNVERGKWRTKCREMLAQHLNPSYVRLQPSREDSYSWQVLPEKQRLFEKNLSDHSIRAYKELCDSVGVTFEAVPKTAAPAYAGEQTFTSVLSEPLSFSSRINELQVQNTYLTQQLQLLQAQLEAEVKQRLSVDDRLKLSYDRTEDLQNELKSTVRRESYFRDLTMKYSQGISRLVPIVDELQQNPGITDGGFL